MQEIDRVAMQFQFNGINPLDGSFASKAFAMETASLSRAQVLQEVGTAMIAQANQLPEQVLALLR